MYSNDEIKRFQDNLLLIRKILGWTEDELGERIGVTRQTINNLERLDSNTNEYKAKLTKTQYLAMRRVLEDEMRNNKEENEMLANVIDVLVDNPQKYTEEAKEKIIEMANLLAPAIITKSNTKKEVSNQFMGILGALGIAVGTLTLTILTFKGPKGGKK